MGMLNEQGEQKGYRDTGRRWRGTITCAPQDVLVHGQQVNQCVSLLPPQDVSFTVGVKDSYLHPAQYLPFRGLLASAVGP